MENCILPIDICETIIDACEDRTDATYDYDDNFACYSSWKATALVCHAWYLRTRFNILHTVILSRPHQITCLIRTVTERPSLGLLSLVRRIHIYTDLEEPKFMPFVPLFRVFKGPLRLHLNLDWKSAPLWYLKAAVASRPPVIVELGLGATSLSMSDVCRLIWALPELQTLRLWGDIKEHPVSDANHPDVQTLASARRRPTACQNLVDLSLHDPVPWNITRFPRMAFGVHVTTLNLDIGTEMNESIGDCIREFACLRALDAKVLIGPPPSPRPGQEFVFKSYEDDESDSCDAPPDSLHYAVARSRGQCTFCGVRSPLGEPFQQHMNKLCSRRPTTALFTVLGWIQSKDAFRTLCLRLEPLLSYETHRAGLVELIFGDSMRDALARFPALDDMRVEVEDQGEQCNASWWKKMISDRNPRLMNILSTTIQHRPDRFDPGKLWTKDPAVSEPWWSSPSRPIIRLQQESVLDWLAECDVCRMKVVRVGNIVDPDLPVFACRSCERWQHIACYESRRSADRDQPEYERMQQGHCLVCQMKTGGDSVGSHPVPGLGGVPVPAPTDHSVAGDQGSTYLRSLLLADSNKFGLSRGGPGAYLAPASFKFSPGLLGSAVPPFPLNDSSAAAVLADWSTTSPPWYTKDRHSDKRAPTLRESESQASPGPSTSYPEPR